MNSVKIVYIISSLISESLFLALAVFSPIYITPGYYWWTVFGIIIFFTCGLGFSLRLNSWNDFGKVN